jgi:hypothetical protein
MELDLQVAPNTSTNVFGGLSQRQKEEVEGGTNNDNPNIRDDFDDM